MCVDLAVFVLIFEAVFSFVYKSVLYLADEGWNTVR